MPLPPVGVDAWRRFAADRWKGVTDATISRVRSGLWDMQAEDAIARLRPLQVPEPEPIYQPPESVYEPPPPPPPSQPEPAPQSPLEALRGGIGSALSGIGGRASTALSGAQAGVGGWASRADAAIDDLSGQLAGGFAQAQAAPLPTLEAPSTWEPSTPLEQAGALASRLPRAAAQPFQELPDALTALPYRFGEGVDALRAGSREQEGRRRASVADAAAGFNEALGREAITPDEAAWWSDTGANMAGGLRRGQRGAVPRLTPEQLAQRAADGAAEQTVFDAIRALWRRGPEGEGAADDLRFLAVGKGQQGLAAARDYLRSKGLQEVLGEASGATTSRGALALVPAAGVASGLPQALSRGREALGALPERAGAFLEEQRRATRDLEARQRAQEEQVLNLTPYGRQLTGEERERELASLRFARQAGESAAGGMRLRRPTAAQVTDVLSSAPLTSPTSQGANFLAGGARTLERIALELGELRPIDALLDAGTTGKTLLSPSTWKKARQAFGSGPTPRNPGAAGSSGADSLANAPGLAPAILTSGTRANAALDEVIRTANEAGARRVGARRGLTGKALDDFVAKAGDYATITGKNSPLAHALTHAKGWMSDPAATPTQKTVGHVANALSGYVNMPERVMAATLRGVLSPVEGGFKLTKGALTRDSDLAREGFSRLLYGGILDWKLAQMAGGDIEGLRVYGPPPRDQQLREVMEREGARWDSFVLGDPKRPTAVIPTRDAGIWGEQASLIGGLYTAAVQADREGRTGPLKVLDISNQLAKQTLSDSYLSDYAEFANKIDDLKGVQAAATTLAAYPSRAVALAAGPVNASDPYVRETNAYEGFGPALSRLVPGGRYLLPAKTDPTTGEPLRRRGTGWSRYWGAESGTQVTEQAQELSRLGLNPHDFRSGEYAGEKQAPAALARVKQTVGSEAGKAVREAMATPAYKEADDAGKKAQLQQALRDADFEAALRLGDTVKRSPRQQADWEYSAVPRYQGIKKDAPAEEVRRYNRDVAAAKRARTEARKKYPNAPDKGQAEWARANPEQNRLAQRGEADAATLKRRREEIDQKYGVER